MDEVPTNQPPRDEAQITRAFEHAADALGLARAGRGAVVADLLARLREPHRAYHDARHVASCVVLAEEHRAHARRPAEVLLALLFHDAIYVPLARDNEARSAALATTALRGLGASDEVTERVAALVLTTRDHASRGDPDAELVLDCDLAILGADDDAYAAFEDGVRAEHAMVDEARYRAGRARVLEGFLGRTQLYAVPAIARACEARARSRLAAQIARLRGGG